MRWVELRRHAFTKKGASRGRGSHLAQHGIDEARRVGAQIGDVAYVAVSESPRTLETAIAMGFAVDDVVGIAGANVTGEVEFHEWWDWPDPWAVFAQRMVERPKLAEYADTQLEIVRHAVNSIDQDRVALLIGHGGWIEPTVVAAVGTDRIDAWGPSFNHLEGVRLIEDGGEFRVATIHRLS